MCLQSLCVFDCLRVSCFFLFFFSLQCDPWMSHNHMVSETHGVVVLSGWCHCCWGSDQLFTRITDQPPRLLTTRRAILTLIVQANTCCPVRNRSCVFSTQFRTVYQHTHFSASLLLSSNFSLIQGHVYAVTCHRERNCSHTHLRQASQEISRKAALCSHFKFHRLGQREQRTTLAIQNPSNPAALVRISGVHHATLGDTAAVEYSLVHLDITLSTGADVYAASGMGTAVMVTMIYNMGQTWDREMTHVKNTHCNMCQDRRQG